MNVTDDPSPVATPVGSGRGTATPAPGRDRTETMAAPPTPTAETRNDRHRTDAADGPAGGGG